MARSLNDLAWLSCNEGQYADADRLSRRPLTIREKALGHQDIEIGRNLSDLAWFQIRQERYDESEQNLERALTILEREGPASRVDLAACLNRLGVLDRALSKLDAAKALLERALAIRAESLGPEHAYVAESLSNLATVLRDQGPRFARPLYERAMGTFEKTVGPDHPGLAWTLTNFGLLESAEGHEEKAEALLRRGLSIREKTFGPNHPEVALSLDHYAGLLRKTGRVHEAEGRKPCQANQGEAGESREVSPSSHRAVAPREPAGRLRYARPSKRIDQIPHAAYASWLYLGKAIACSGAFRQRTSKARANRGNAIMIHRRLVMGALVLAAVVG